MYTYRAEKSITGFFTVPLNAVTSPLPTVRRYSTDPENVSLGFKIIFKKRRHMQVLPTETVTQRKLLQKVLERIYPNLSFNS